MHSIFSQYFKDKVWYKLVLDVVIDHSIDGFDCSHVPLDDLRPSPNPYYCPSN